MESTPRIVADGVNIVAFPQEHIDSIVRRFKKATSNSMILKELRKHEYFVSKRERRRIKQRAAQARRFK